DIAAAAADSDSQSMIDKRLPLVRSASHAPVRPGACSSAGMMSSRTWAMPASTCSGVSWNVTIWAHMAGSLEFFLCRKIYYAMPRRARPTPEYLRPDEFQAWHGLLLASTRVVRALDEGLRTHHGISVAEFDVLITLFNAPDKRLRMADLARSVALSPA